MPKKKPPTIPEQLKAAIAASGLTPYAIGKASRVSPSMIQRFLHGERGLNLETAGKLCAALDLTLTKRET